jgi:hypothetical protein
LFSPFSQQLGLQAVCSTKHFFRKLALCLSHPDASIRNIVLQLLLVVLIHNADGFKYDPFCFILFYFFEFRLLRGYS